MMAWVAGVVRVMPHWTCGFAMALVRNENGVGGSSPGCISSAGQSIVLPSRRGGVPVLSRPKVRPIASRVLDRPRAGASPTRPAGILRSPMWIRPRRKVPVVRTTAPAAKRRPSRVTTPAASAVVDDQVVDFGGDDREVRVGAQQLLHVAAVELAVGLGAGAADGGALRAVEQAELDAGAVGDDAHDAVEGVDLADQMAFAQTADGRVARHLADGLDLVRDQRGARARRARRPSRPRSRRGLRR